MFLDGNDHLVERHSYPPRNDVNIAHAVTRRFLQDLPPILGKSDTNCDDDFLSTGLWPSRGARIDDIKINHRSSDEETLTSDEERTRELLPSKEVKYVKLLEELRKDGGASNDPPSEVDGICVSSVKASNSVSSQKNILKMMNQRMCALERHLQESDRRHEDLISTLRLEHKQAMEDIRQRLDVGLKSGGQAEFASNCHRIADDVAKLSSEMEAALKEAESLICSLAPAIANEMSDPLQERCKKSCPGLPLISMCASFSTPSDSVAASLSARDTVPSRSDSFSGESGLDSSDNMGTGFIDGPIETPVARILTVCFDAHSSVSKPNSLELLVKILSVCKSFLGALHKALIEDFGISRSFDKSFMALDATMARLLCISMDSVNYAGRTAVQFRNHLTAGCLVATKRFTTGASFCHLEAKKIVAWACQLVNVKLSILMEALRSFAATVRSMKRPCFAEVLGVFGVLVSAAIMACYILHTHDAVDSRIDEDSGSSLPALAPSFESMEDVAGTNLTPHDCCSAEGSLAVMGTLPGAAAKQNALSRMVQFSALGGMMELAFAISRGFVHFTEPREEP